MSRKSEDSVIERAKKRLKREVERNAEMYKIGRTCMEFVGGEQWDPDDVKDRKDTRRPMITVNKLGTYVNVVVNKSTMEGSRIKAVPFENADVNKAKVVNGLIRRIQYSDKSDSGNAYASAYFNLVSCGYGYFQIDTEYRDECSMDQEIVIVEIEDGNTVYLDPEGNFGFIVKFMHKDDFEAKYGDGEVSSWDIEDLVAGDEEVMVVEYYEKTETDTELYKVTVTKSLVSVPETDVDAAIGGMTNREPDSRTVCLTKEKFEELAAMAAASGWQVEVHSTRPTKIPKVKKYILAGDKTLKEDDWAGKHIPIVGCYARKFKKRDGSTFRKPLIFDAMGSQRLYNFYRSQDAEFMQMAPKQPFIGAEGQFAGHEDEFSGANIDHVPYLEYKPVTVDGQLAPPPQRSSPPQPGVGFYQNIMTASDEIKATTGIFDPSLGAQGNETSGKAIIARQRQGDVATAHFSQAFDRALRKAGIILVDLIPKIYDTERTIRILGEDLAEDIVKINAPFVDEKTGKQVLYDMTVGEYDIVIDVGANSITRRMDAAENLMEFARVVPKVGEVSGDLIAQNMDFENADELALRLRAALDPRLLERVKQLEKGVEEQGPTPEQQQAMVLQQQMQVVVGKLQQAQQGLEGLSRENAILKNKISSDQLMIARIRAAAGIQEQQIRSEADIEKKRIEVGSDNNPMSPAALPVPYENQNWVR